MKRTSFIEYAILSADYRCSKMHACNFSCNKRKLAPIMTVSYSHALPWVMPHACMHGLNNMQLANCFIVIIIMSTAI